jgi:hypothetical protein
VAVARHLRRAFLGGAHRTDPTEREASDLASVGIDSPLVQRYVVWRRSVLLVAVPFTIFSAVLAVRELLERDLDGYSAFGVLAVAIVGLAVPVLTVTVVLAAVTWRDPRLSGRVLFAGWAVSMFAPLVVAMFPLDWLVSSSLSDVTGVDSGDDRTELVSRIAVSIQYAIVLLPSLLSFPSGLVRGAARVKRMLPAGTIAGWVLVIMTPVYAVFFVLALILVQHLAGNGILLVGAGLLAASPFVHLAALKLYVFPLTTDGEVRRLDRVQRLGGAVGAAGMVTILIWAFTATIGDKRIIGGGDALLDELGAVLAALELVARVLVTSVVFSYLLLQVTESAWRHDREYVDRDAFERHIAEMTAVGRSLGATGDRLR